MTRTTKGAALVTGAAQGIGRAVAMRLAADGLPVCLLDINADELDRTSADILSSVPSAQVMTAVCDVANEAMVRAALARCAQELGSMSAVVNNAGVDLSTSPGTVTREQWQRVHEVDLWGAMLVVREALPFFNSRGGAIVNIASNHALATVADRGAYASAKAGLVGLTRALAIDLGPRDICVNVVLPGYIQTRIWDMWLGKLSDPHARLSEIAKRHPLRRLGRPEDVAGLVSFLCGPDSRFITGAALVVDGGNTAMLEHPFE